MMAAQCSMVSDKAPGTLQLSSKDAELLELPAVQAAYGFGSFSQEMMLQALKEADRQKLTISADVLLPILDSLALQGPLPECSSSKKGASEHQSSDEDEMPDSALARMDVDSSDLQTDGGSHSPAVFQQLEKLGSEEEKPVVKSPGRPGTQTDIHSLRQRVKVLKSENRRLKERSLCKNCGSKPVSITFLPCGHYSFCYDCGQTFSSCPICKKTILADVRTFLA